MSTEGNVIHDDRFDEAPKRRRNSWSSDENERKPKMSYQQKVDMKRELKEAEWRAKREQDIANRPKKPVELKIPAPAAIDNLMMEIICNDRLGKKVRVKCFPKDTIENLKLLISAHTGTRADKIRLQKSYTIFKDHITVDDYEIKDGM